MYICGTPCVWVWCVVLHWVLVTLKWYWQDNLWMREKVKSFCWCKTFVWAKTKDASLVLKLAVWMIRVPNQTVLPADLIVSGHSLHFPLVWTLFDLFSPSGKSLLISVRPWLALLAAAAATAADCDADQDNSTQHSQRDDQSLKVQPADAPSSLGQLTHGGRGQQPTHRVIRAVVGGETPQTPGIWDTGVTASEGRTWCCWWRSCLTLCVSNKHNKQHDNRERFSANL